MTRRQRRRSASAVLAPQSAVPAAVRTWSLIWPTAVLFGVALVVYARALECDFIGLDDTLYVTENPHVQSGLSAPNVGWAVSTLYAANWSPLTWLSLLLDTSLFGVRSGGYHLTNVLLHAANTGVLFAALARATNNPARSAFVAAVFAVHPLHVESVAWISERKDVLSTFFGLLSLSSYIQHAAHRRKRGLAMSFFWLVLSLMAKPTLVTLPFVFLLLDYWPLDRFAAGLAGRRPASAATNPATNAETSHRGPRASALWRRARGLPIVGLVTEKWPHFAAAAAFSIVAVIAQAKSNAVRPFAAVPLGLRLENALVAYASYLGQSVWPRGLSVFYPYLPEKLTGFAVGASAAMVLGISLAALRLVRRRPYFFVGWFWYLGTLVPMIGIVQIGLQQRADRYMYFPLIGLSLAVAWLVPELVPAGNLRRRALPVLAVAATVLLAAAAFVQIGKWKNSLVLFSHSLACTDDNAFGRYLLGTAQLKAGRLSEALANLESAARLDPQDADVQYNLANGLKTAGRTEEAAAHYRAALSINDELADAHNNLGLILLKRGEYQEAKRHFERTLEIEPNHLRAYVNLGELCVKTGDYARAISYSERALALDPSLLNAHLSMALALRGLGRIDEALVALNRLARGAPGDEEVRRELEKTAALKQGSK